ncbi:MAG: nucleotidyltransferase [Clostridiales bacterium]|jgi:NDP-sugar pyrophosphorylase family protein|nr:nucleotidyltransferase [Clostridiales bacterium]
MKKPVLVILAAGIGSRFGGLKQIAPVDDEGHLIIDFSMYDAKEAGFETIICIIKPEIEAAVKEHFGDHVSKQLDLRYAYQLPDTLPAGFSIPESRNKPWGTAHAILATKDMVDSPVVVINADDFYGRSSYQKLYDYLANNNDPARHALVSYQLEKTLTDHGHVARGVCKTEGSKLIEIIERTHIEKRSNGAVFTEDGENFEFLPEGTIVSMNFWGFMPSIYDKFENRFPDFLKENLSKNPLKCEYLLPTVVNDLIKENRVTFDTIPTTEKWYGVTYKEDMPSVQAAISRMKLENIYPARLWE